MNSDSASEKRPPTARDLIEAQAGEPPNFGGAERPFRGAMRRPMSPASMGRPTGDFSPRDTSLMKDFMLLELVRGQGSFYEKIVSALTTGAELETGQLQHFIDEVERVPGLTEQHMALVKKIQQVIGQRAKPGSEPLPPAA